MNSRVKLGFAALMAISVCALFIWLNAPISIFYRTDNNRPEPNESKSPSPYINVRTHPETSSNGTIRKSPDHQRVSPLSVAEQEQVGELASRTLLEFHLSPSDLNSQLSTLKNRLSFIGFSKVMRLLVMSPWYSAEEKATVFNEFLPYEKHFEGPPVYPVYNDIAADWGILPENRDQFFDFIENIDSPEFQKMLATAYFQVHFSKPKQFGELVVEESDLKNPSYLGKDQIERIERLGWLIDSMLSGKRATVAELAGIVNSLDIEGEFKTALLNAIHQRHDIE